MKIAFITHAIGIGGGSLSSSMTIQYLLEKEFLKPENCIILHEERPEPTNEKNDVYFKLRSSIKFFQVRLPFSLAYKGSNSQNNAAFYEFYRFVLMMIKSINFLLFYNKILNEEEVTVVHLNSLVLWPLLPVLPGSMKKIIHIREVPNDSVEARIAIFIIRRYATKIISIDPISDIPFSDSGKSVVILNPISMTTSRALRSRKNELKREWGISPGSFVVSIFGRIGEQKGFGFFLELVDSCRTIKNLIFIIIGKPSGKFGEDCIQKLTRYSHVKYFGEHQDTSPFFAITDVVIRCEDYLPLGRTVWEAIYAGSIALVPYNKTDDLSVIQEYLGNYVYPYRALDRDSCRETLKKIIEEYPGTVIDTGFPVSDNLSKSAEHFLKEITP